ncbi:MAG: SCO family protein [Planctomycetota bacterium]
MPLRQPSFTILVALLLLAAAGPTTAQTLTDLPPEMQGVGIDDKSGDQVPLDLRFRDERGKAISLADVFTGDRPVLLSLNYSDCPMLCGLQLDGLVRSLKELKLVAGKDYTLVSVSVDPLEQPVRARMTQQKYAREYGRSGAAGGFKFLTGPQESITALADAIGFRYKYVPATGEYSHSAATMVVSPTGVLSRYLYGVMYDVPTLRLSLVEAGEGKIGTPLDQIILFCFHYNDSRGEYTPVARKMLSAGAALTVFVLGAGLLPYWFRRSSKNTETPEDDDPPTGAAPETVAAETPERELAGVG